MREILFRGKDADSGLWCYGDLAHDREGNPRIRFWGHNGYLVRSVIPETVGQFTGLTDQNNKRIFEGDILQYFDNEVQLVEWSGEWGQLMLHTYSEYEHKRGRKVVKETTEGWNCICDYPLREMTILGNIFDNPELLEVNKNA